MKVIKKDAMFIEIGDFIFSKEVNAFYYVSDVFVDKGLVTIWQDTNEKEEIILREDEEVICL